MHLSAFSVRPFVTLVQKVDSVLIQCCEVNSVNMLRWLLQFPGHASFAHKPDVVCAPLLAFATVLQC
jgi:hypothetical protein